MAICYSRPRADRGVRPSGATPLREEVDLFLEKELGSAPSYTTSVDGNDHPSIIIHAWSRELRGITERMVN